MARLNTLQTADRPPLFAPDVVGSPAGQPGRRDFKTILVPLKLSGSPLTGLAIGWNLARESGARLVLLHVAQLNIAGEEHGIDRAGLLNDLCRDAERQLAQLAHRLGDDVETETLVCEGNPAETIVEVAQSLAADAVVLRARNRGWLNWLRPPTTDRVARQAPCPVWLVAPATKTSAMTITIVDRVNARQSPTPPGTHESERSFSQLNRSLQRG